MKSARILFLLSSAALLVVVASISGNNDVAFIKEAPDSEQRELEMASEDGPVVNGQPKSQWPELVGKTSDEAKQLLQQEAPNHRIQILQHGMMATMDYRTDRVRVWLNEAGNVARAPMIG